MLSKKDYIAIAKIINDNSYITDDASVMAPVSYLIEDLCDYFKKNNPNFDKDKFIEAAELKNHIS